MAYQPISIFFVSIIFLNSTKGRVISNLHTTIIPASGSFLLTTDVQKISDCYSLLACVILQRWEFRRQRDTPGLEKESYLKMKSNQAKISQIEVSKC